MKKALTLGLIVSLLGCARLPMKKDSYVERPAGITEEFFQGLENGYGYDVIEERRNYDIVRICFDSGYEDEAIVDYYQLKKQGKHALILVYPILGGDNIVSKIFADYFANRNYHSAIVHRNNKLKKCYDFEKAKEIVKQDIVNNLNAIDLLSNFEEVDDERIGSFGVSMGGIRGVIIAGLEEMLKCNVLALAGGDISEIIMESKEKGIIKYRNRTMKRYGIDEHGLKKGLEYVFCDLDYAKHLDPSKTLMFIPLFDNKVPTKYQFQLRNEIGCAVYLLFTGHYTSAIYLIPPFNLVQRKSLQFFNDCFEY